MPGLLSLRQELERERLVALHALALLDTPRDERLDELLHTVARRFDVPITLLSLVDAQRVWFKATVGTALQQIPREHTFCSVAVQQEALFVVPDTRADPRWTGNPYVVGEPGVRFYAGAPLRAVSGHVVGTLCLIDTRARQLDAGQRWELETMADFIGGELIVRQSVMAPSATTRY